MGIEIVEVNEELADAPEIINDDPYAKGWIAKIKLSDAAEADDLLDASTYTSFVEEEAG